MSDDNITIIKIEESKSLLDNDFVSQMLEEIKNPDNIQLSYSKYGLNIRFIGRDIEYSISYHKNGSRIDIFRFVYYNRNMDNGINVEDALQSEQITQLWEVIKTQLNNVL